jgi:NAD(P)H-flavin reductase/ferredoxin
MSTKIRFEPIGEEIGVESGETVLDAAFRQGYNLAYGCREGQCSACKCFLLEGDVELKRYSNFALSDTERDNGYSLMCRAMPETDVVVELLHYDPDNYRLAHPIRDGRATVEAVEPLTQDISRLVLRVSEPSDFAFTPGQYVDLHVPGDTEGARRSFSLANLPDKTEPRLELMIKRYPGGRISGLLEQGAIKPGDEIGFTGPYGAMRARTGERPILMVAGGSGMAPVLSLLRQFAADACERPIRFFYGARTDEDLFHLDEIAAVGAGLTDFAFAPVTGRFVHEVVDGFLGETPAFVEADVYMCGPPPMLEAAEEMLIGSHKFDEQRIFQDKFTTSADASPSDVATDTGAPPVKKISDNAAPVEGDEREREFSWFTPRRKRASLYEDVTIDTQPSIHRHLSRGWPVSFEDGRGTWDDNSTALLSSEWFDFRDPGEQWERTYYQLGSAYEQQLEGAMKAAIEEGLLGDYKPDWVEFLRDFLQVPAFVENGLWFATATVARDALSDSISHCIALQAAMKQRSAQAIVLYAMDLEAFHGSFAIETARQAFLEAPEWQPLRRYLEKLAATHDWGEVLIAANVLLEPLAGTLLRRELGTRAAAANGDIVTPALARAATHEWEWIRAWTIAFCRFLLDDERFAAINRATIDGWLAEWLPEAIEATAALTPIAERVPGGLDADRALNDVRQYAATMLIDCGLGAHTAVLGIEPVVDDEVAIDAGPGGPARTRRVRTGKAARARVGAAAGGNATQTNNAGAAEPIPASLKHDHETYDFVGIVMAKSAEGDAVAAVMRRRDGVTVHEQAAFWDVRCEGKLVIPFDEVSDQLGYEIDSYSIQHEMSTHYGRMVATDDALMLFSDPTEAMQYLMA